MHFIMIDFSLYAQIFIYFKFRSIQFFTMALHSFSRIDHGNNLSQEITK